MGCSVDHTQQVGWYVILTKRIRAKNKGQAVVEFTLVAILLLVIIWIPADFGLAFMTGQLASNAAREGARIGSATPKPFDASFVADVRTETCRRLQSALLSEPSGGSGTKCSSFSNAKVDVQLLPGVGSCNDMVRITVSGNYNFFFYQLLHLMGVTGNLNSETITRTTSMRWEHQC